MKFTIQNVWEDEVKHPKLKQVEKPDEHSYLYEVEISSLEEFMELQKELGYPLILSGTDIEIYDDWRE